MLIVTFSFASRCCHIPDGNYPALLRMGSVPRGAAEASINNNNKNISVPTPLSFLCLNQVMSGRQKHCLGVRVWSDTKGSVVWKAWPGVRAARQSLSGLFAQQPL